jgi:predicted cation transporter
MYQVTRIKHPLLIIAATHINTIHLAEISLMMMIITGDNIIEGRIACLVAASSLLLELLELTYLKLPFGCFLVNATIGRLQNTIALIYLYLDAMERGHVGIHH